LLLGRKLMLFQEANGFHMFLLMPLPRSFQPPLFSQRLNSGMSFLAGRLRGESGVAICQANRIARGRP
jgi:hypothetical protein